MNIFYSTTKSRKFGSINYDEKKPFDQKNPKLCWKWSVREQCSTNYDEKTLFDQKINFFGAVSDRRMTYISEILHGQVPDPPLALLLRGDLQI